jgi:alkylhydroperoxidase family enzyme
MPSSYWSSEWFLEFSDLLAANVEADPNLIGLIFLGSAAETARADEWSDHDFFLVTREGVGEDYRSDLSWLPFNDQIAWSPRETAHGLKVVYDFGHVLEFAVFNDSELELAKVNATAVAVDKGGILERIDRIREASKATQAPDWDGELEILLTHILIGVGRYRRGETLIAGEQIRSYLLASLLGLVPEWLPAAAGTEQTIDNLNRFRRFELRYPEVSARIEVALTEDVETAAKRLLELVEELHPAVLPKSAVVRRRLGWS